MYRWVLLLFVFVAVVLGLVVGTLNPALVTFDLLVLRVQWPLGALLLVSFVSGFVVASVFATLGRWFQKRNFRR